MLSNFEREHNVVHQDDDGRFAPDCEDVEIIRTLAAENPKPVWITADLTQKKNPAERAALRESRMTVFFAKRHRLTPHTQSLKWLAVWPTVVDFALTAKVPTAFMIPFGRLGGRLNTKIDRLGPTAGLFK